MKKLITLLLVLTGCVMSASAWNNVYLRCNVTPSGQSNAWDNDLDAYHFSKIDDSDFVLKLDGSLIHDGALWFRPNMHDWGQISPAENNSPNIDMTGDYAYDTNWRNTSYYFIVQQKASANAIYIRVKFDKDGDGGSKWFKVYVLVTEESFTVNYTDPYDWNGVSAFAQYNHIPLNGTWAGGSMSGSHPNYSVTIPAKSGAKITFAKTANAGNRTSEFDFVNNGNYTYSGLQGITASISSVGYATFSSTKAVDFTSESTIEACKASVDNGKITYTKVTSVAAGEGVLLRRADRTNAAASSVIPLNANQSVARNSGNDLYGITAKQKIDRITESGYTNFILAKPSDVLGFFKVNESGSWCGAGTAYLKVANGNLPASSREFFALDDETTGIEAVNNVSTESANDAREYYNLNGQRVMNPSKGLYIVNGKKVIIK